MDDQTKFITFLNNAFILLGKKIDTLASSIKSSKSIETPINVKLPDNFRVDLPPIHMPKMPDMPAFPSIPAPIVNVPTPVVNVEPNITVQPTPVEFPEEMEVKGFRELGVKLTDYLEQEQKNPLEGVSHKKPLPMIILGKDGKQITNFGGDMTAPSVVGLKVGTTQVSEAAPLPVTEGLNIPQYDYISLSYTGDNLTGVVYKTGGSSGETVATLVLAYSGSTLTSVTKT